MPYEKLWPFAKDGSGRAGISKRECVSQPRITGFRAQVCAVMEPHRSLQAVSIERPSHAERPNYIPECPLSEARAR
jgi:hypothetical protein